MLTAVSTSTHLAPLAGCVAHTDGPVIELGAGLYSTSVLHAICEGRELVTVDNDAGWLDRLRYLETDWHRFVAVDDWSTCDLLDQKWSVAFVDQAPGWTRLPTIKRLRKGTELIVVHDAPADARYGSEIEPFRYRAEFLEPGVDVRTAVASDMRPIPIASPDLLANHVSLGVRLEDISWSPSSQWSVGLTRELPPLPAHFYLTGELELSGFDSDQVEVQALFRTTDAKCYYSHTLTAKSSIPPRGALAVSEAAEAHGKPEWSAVERLEIRARAEGAGTVALSNLDLLALRPSADRKWSPRSTAASAGNSRE